MANPARRRPPTIMLVEKDESLRSALAFAFETEGFAVACYADAEAALAAPRGSYACVVVDHHQPAMAWHELLQRLRAEDDATPAVLIASQPSRATCAEAQASSVEIVQKPLIGTELSDAVRRALGG